MRRLALAFVCLLLASFAAADSVEPPTLPAFGPSVVFGPAGALTGGELHVGILLPTPPSERLVDLIPPELWASFCTLEATRAHAKLMGLHEPEYEEEIEVEEVVDWGTYEHTVHRADPTGYDLVPVSGRIAAATKVRVVFHSVLAAECDGCAAVIVPRELEYAQDAAHLRQYVAAGGLVFQDTADAPALGEARPGVLGRATQDPQVLIDVCRETIARSARVHHLDADPLDLVEAAREGDDVVVRLAKRPTAVTVLDLENEPVGQAEVEADGTVRVLSPDEGERPFRERLVATFTEGDLTLRRSWTIMDLVGTAERRVHVPTIADAGSTYAPRVLFFNSLTRAPVEGREESLTLVRGDTVLATVTGCSGPAGSLDTFLRIPADVEPGAATLRVGDEEFPVRIRPGLRISLVTDRALYRATDRVHARVMVHRAGDGRPVANEPVLLKLLDVEKEVTTSEHGIASTSFSLVGAKLGHARVQAEVNGATAYSKLQVRAFERPTFTVEADPARIEAKVGDAVPVKLLARYVNGTPVLNAKVHVGGPDTILLSPGREGRTNAVGRFDFTARVRGEAKRSSLRVTVTDADGRKATVRVPVHVATETRRLRLDPLEEAIVGRPCRFRVESSEPGPLTVSVGGKAVATLEFAEAGSREVVISPPDQGFKVHLDAGSGTPAAWPCQAAKVAPGQPLVLPDRRTACVGETLGFTIEGWDGPVWVDVMRDEAQIRALSTRIENGRGRIDLVFDPDLAGVLDVRAWRFVDDEPIGTSVRVLVTRGRSLAVEATSSQETWRPGERAFVDVTVRDREGDATAAVLGYWGVDEALLALSDLPDGHEEVFDVLGRSSTSCRGLAQRVESGDAPALSAALGPLGRHRSVNLRHRRLLMRRSTPRHQSAVAAARRARAERAVTDLRATYIEAFEAVPVEALRTAHSLREVMAFLVRGGHLEPDRLLDPWGTPWELGRRPQGWTHHRERGWWSCEWGTLFVSAGPDLVPGTADDLRHVWREPWMGEFDGPVGRFLRFLAESAAPEVQNLLDTPFAGPISGNSLIGLGGGAGGAFGGRGGSKDMGGGGGGRRAPEAVHVRRDFDPTLCFVPEAIIGPGGKATLEIPLKDSITTWRLRLVASAADGATGVCQSRLRVSQPLHVNPWIAPHLTIGDELELPVSVRNETDEVLDVALSLVLSEHLAVDGEASALVSVPPGGTGVHRFRYRAVARGSARVRVDAEGGAHRDAIERVVSVRPNAREVVDVANGLLSPEQPWLATLPVLEESVPREHRVSVYPSPLAETLDGFEGLIACPHG